METSVLLSVVHILVILSPGLSVFVSCINDDISNLRNSLTHLQQTIAQQGAELAATKTSLKSTTDQLQSTKDELFAVKTELQSTTAQLISVKSDLKSIEAECFNETKSDGSNTTPHLSGVLADVNSMKTGLDVLYRDEHTNVAEIQALKDELANLTNLQSRNNIGFLVSSKFGDNGVNHSGVVFNVANSTNLIFSQVALNSGNSLDVKTGVMTAPVTGIYLFRADISMTLSDYRAKLVMTTNLEVLAEHATTTGRAVFSVPVYLVKGQGVAAQVVGDNLIYKRTADSRFGGVLIRAF